MRGTWIALSCLFFFVICGVCAVSHAEVDPCVSCHEKLTPGQVKDWKISKHSSVNVTCSTCHGSKHISAKDAKLAQMPDEQICGRCHEKQLSQFGKGKHNFGWTSMNALPINHVEPDELIEGGRGCGGCHNMGIKTEARKREQLDKGYRYRMNSCDECHTRHTFSKKEASDPRACQQCHMGYDHPQWEMWISAKHGTRWFARNSQNLPAEASAPKCQDCHMSEGSHENRTAWGFLGVRLPLRAYQAFFHVNPDYAYWYGWAMMVKDLGEIKELAATMRATHKK